MVKRLILAIDGTWVNSDNGYDPSILGPTEAGNLAAPSNITRLCRALVPRSQENIEQIVHYQGGLGSEGNWYSFAVGGYLGAGIDEAIREAYGFLANNYEDGDEIFIIGFSRGGFTARSVGGFLADIGLLTKLGMESFYPIFMDWENQNIPTYQPGYGTAAWPKTSRPKFKTPAYLQGLVDNKLTRPHVPIKAIAVFDTVGTLGVPDVKPLGWSLYRSSKAEYSFINTQVAPNVEHAYQALALDERRGAFPPTVWESPRAGKRSILRELRQCWFPGVHTSIGGGFQDTSISNITLAWMMTQLSRHLAFDPAYLARQAALDQAFHAAHAAPAAERGYGLGLIRPSDTGLLNSLLGRRLRTPGQYHLTDPATGEDLPDLLRDTCEFVHPCVRYRRDVGRGVARTAAETSGSGRYEPAALAGWEFVRAGQDVPGLRVEARWAKAAKWVKEDRSVYIVEESLEEGSFDRVLAESYGGAVAAIEEGM